MKKILFTIAIALIGQTMAAQTIADYEARIVALFDTVAAATDTGRNRAYNDSINTLIISALKMTQSFDYPFDRLKYMGVVTTDDNALRLYTWNMPTDSGTLYNGLIQKADGNIVVLQHNTRRNFPPDEWQTMADSTWYGALYYRAITYKVNRQKVYLLLGWHGQPNRRTQHKFIDVLWFDEAGRAQFGQPLLADDIDRSAKSRLVLEYDADATIYLDYDAAKRRIVFDHLSPMKYFDDDTTTLGPDMSVDAYVRKPKYWLLKTDIHAKNKHQK